MDFLTAQDFTHPSGETTHYYSGGNLNGIPLIFIHGWPDIAESWKHQLKHFSSKESPYRVIAPDMRGYGQSSGPQIASAYSLETLTKEMSEFAAHLGIKKAVWIGHDWGCGVVNALAAHYPDLFLGLAVLAVPYRTIELGLDHLVSTVNREIYPEKEWEYGQWAYQKYYETNTAQSIESFSNYTDKITKAMYARQPDLESKHGEIAHTARVIRDGGWFAGHPEKIPDIPLENTSLDTSLFLNLVASHARHGWFPPTAYYLNHASNAAFSKHEKNEGKLDFPVLFIDAKYDAVCSTSTSPLMAKGMREKVKDLEEERVDAAHWVQLERPEEVNEVLGRWLYGKF